VGKVRSEKGENKILSMRAEKNNEQDLRVSGVTTAHKKIAKNEQPISIATS